LQSEIGSPLLKVDCGYKNRGYTYVSRDTNFFLFSKF
jgi:hypothetical protein